MDGIEIFMTITLDNQGNVNALGIPPHHAPKQCLQQHHLTSQLNGKNQICTTFCPHQVPISPKVHKIQGVLEISKTVPRMAA